MREKQSVQAIRRGVRVRREILASLEKSGLAGIF